MRFAEGIGNLTNNARRPQRIELSRVLKHFGERFAFDKFADDKVVAFGQFAGIELSEFYWARQRAKRVLLFWVTAVLILTGLVATAAWTLGSNLPGLL